MHCIIDLVDRSNLPNLITKIINKNIFYFLFLQEPYSPPYIQQMKSQSLADQSWRGYGSVNANTSQLRDVAGLYLIV